MENFAEFHDYIPLTRHKYPHKEGGGIALYIKNNIQYRQRTDLQFPECKNHLYDSIVIEVVNDHPSRNAKNIILFVIYRTPSQNSIAEITSDLNILLDKVKQENKTVIITGDLNIDLLKYETNSLTAQFLDMFISFNLIPSITKPTRVTHQTATLIDHIFTNADPNIMKAGTILSDITDHFCNFISINIRPTRDRNPKYITYRKQDSTSLNKFRNALLNIDWSSVTDENNPDIAYEKFTDIFIKIMNEHLPVVKRRFNKYKHKKEPWITPGILKSLKRKEKLYTRMIHSAQLPSYNTNVSEYKTYENIYKKVLKQAKRIYWRDRFETVKSDMKQTWKNINDVLHKSYNKQEFPDKFKLNGSILTDHGEIASQFNNYFTNIGPTLASKIGQHGNTSHLSSQENFPCSLFFEPCSPNEIENILQCMKPKSSCGYDDISPKLSKQSADILALPLSHIVNISMQTGIFPSLMKIAKVIPVYKKDDSQSFTNYRPISLLPAFSKILEKVIHKRLLHYLNIKNIISFSQYGFQPNSSTELAVLELQDRIVKSIAAHKFCLGLSVDLSKAFDTLNHDILFSKLEVIGIRGITLSWFKSYLSNRKQFVKFKDSNSSFCSITCGVPQGSILGPLLFLIYMNDLPSTLSSSIAILFADDTTLLIDNNNYDALIDQMNIEVERLYKWFCANKLSMNEKKN